MFAEVIIEILPQLSHQSVDREFISLEEHSPQRTVLCRRLAGRRRTYLARRSGYFLT